MEFDGQVWFWTKVCVLLFYVLVLLLKARGLELGVRAWWKPCILTMTGEPGTAAYQRPTSSPTGVPPQHSKGFFEVGKPPAGVHHLRIPMILAQHGAVSFDAAIWCVKDPGVGALRRCNWDGGLDAAFAVM